MYKHTLTVQGIREKVSSPKFDVSQFFEEQLRGKFHNADLEHRIVDICNDIEEKVRAASADVDADVERFEELISNYNSKLADQLESYQSNLSLVERELEDIASKFSEASDGAVKIGEKLTNAER
jgi:hypothetical protein